MDQAGASESNAEVESDEHLRSWCGVMRQILGDERRDAARAEIRNGGGALNLAPRAAAVQALMEAEDQRARDATADMPGGWDPTFPTVLETDFERNFELQTNAHDSRSAGPSIKNMGRTAPQFIESRPIDMAIPPNGEIRVDMAAVAHHANPDGEVELEFVISPSRPGNILLRVPGNTPMDTRSPAFANDGNEPMGHSSMVPSGTGPAATDETDAVVYAGTVKLDRAGNIISWDNGSGHYEPHPGLARMAGLPMKKFVAYHVKESLAAKKKAIKVCVDEALEGVNITDVVAEAILRDFTAFKVYANSAAAECPANVLLAATVLDPNISAPALRATMNPARLVGLDEEALMAAIHAAIKAAAAKVFVDLSNWLIDNYLIPGDDAEDFLAKVGSELGWPVGHLDIDEARDYVT